MSNFITVETRLKKTAKGLSFATIAEAFNSFANVGSYITEEQESFLRDRHLHEVPAAWLATHSMGGRSFTVAEDGASAFFAEPCFNGGWYIFKEEDATKLYADSATSGSSLTAEKASDGSWTLSLEVPLTADGSPYQGSYWSAFEVAVAQEEEQRQLQEKAEDYLRRGICPPFEGCDGTPCKECLKQYLAKEGEVKEGAPEIPGAVGQWGQKSPKLGVKYWLPENIVAPATPGRDW